jgi:hypothetical protein
MMSLSIRSLPSLVICLVIAAGRGEVSAQTPQRVTGTITYLSGTSVYIDQGRNTGIAAGDTLSVFRKGVRVSRLVVTAISGSSSVAQPFATIIAPAVGDSVVIVKVVELPRTEQVTPTLQSTRLLTDRAPEGTTVHGRIGLQYAGIGESGRRPDFSQPSAILRLDINRLFVTGMTFTMYGRALHDLTDGFSRFQEPRTKLRVFEMSLNYDTPASWFGFSAGRVVSRYVGGLGAIDGGLLFARTGSLTAGILAGTQPDNRTSSYDKDHQTITAFANYAFGGDLFRPADITLAYGQQLMQGRLDRDFLYLQGSFSPDEQLYFYQSTEVDLHTLVDGQQRSSPRLTNTFVTVSYTPIRWLNLNAGYDASRNIYLLESMKTFPDSLFDRELRQGIRTAVMARLPANLSIGANAHLRLPTEGLPSARNLGLSLRAGDILESGINAGMQYTDINGSTNMGRELGADIDRWFGSILTVGLHFDRYSSTLASEDNLTVTSTLGLLMSVRISRTWYAVFSGDRVDDGTRTVFRVFGEVSVHF